MHGVHCTSRGTESDLTWLVQEFEKKHLAKVRGIVGPSVPQPEIHDKFQQDSGVEVTFEADPRHDDMIIKGMGLVKGNESDVVDSANE